MAKKPKKDLFDENFEAMDLPELREREALVSEFVSAYQKLLAGLREQISAYEVAEAAGYTIEEVRAAVAAADNRRASLN